MDPTFMPLQCSSYMQMIFKKCLFKQNSKLSKLFRLIPQGLNLLASSETLQNKILWGIRPCGTKSCGVSEPAEQWQSCVHFVAGACSVGSDTPPNKVLQGIRPCETKFCWVLNTGEQLLNTNISANLKHNSLIFQGVNFGDYSIWGRFVKKKQRQKISCYCPFKVCVVFGLIY